jgi:hypothetical protein
VDSSADAIAVVSWNEFSENSHIEPSMRYGNESLRALASILSATVPETIAADSSDPLGSSGFPVRAVALLVVAFGLIGGSLAAVARRRGRGPYDGRPDDWNDPDQGTDRGVQDLDATPEARHRSW